MGGHDHLRALGDPRGKGDKLVFPQFIQGFVDHGQTGVAVRAGIPVSRKMLQGGDHVLVLQPAYISGAELCGKGRTVRKRTYADHGICGIIVHVHHRGKIYVDPDAAQLRTDDGRSLPRGGGVADRAERHIARRLRPGCQTGDLPALLVHGDQQLRPAGFLVCVLQRLRQTQRLLCVLRVLRKQDNAGKRVFFQHGGNGRVQRFLSLPVKIPDIRHDHLLDLFLQAHGGEHRFNAGFFL